MRSPLVGVDASLLAPSAARQDCGEDSHVVQFFDDESFLADTVTRFVERGLRAGEAAVVIATDAHRRLVEARLEARGVDVAAARRTGRYVAVEATGAVARLMVDGMPDRRGFARLIGRRIRRAAHGGRRRARAFGEMVALLWVRGHGEAALRLEELWNELVRALAAGFDHHLVKPVGAEELEGAVARLARRASAARPPPAR